MSLFLLQSIFLLITVINCGSAITYFPESFSMKSLISYSAVSLSIMFYLNQNQVTHWLLISLFLVTLALLIFLDARPAILNLLLGFLTTTCLYVIFIIFLNGISQQLLIFPATYVVFFSIINIFAILVRWLTFKTNKHNYLQHFWHRNMNKSLILIIAFTFIFYIVSGNLKKTITALPLTILQSFIILAVAIIITCITFVFLQHERQIQSLKEQTVRQQAYDLQLYLHTLKASRHEYNSHLNMIYQLLKTNQLQNLNIYMNDLITDNDYLSNISGLRFPEIGALLYRYELLAKEKKIAFTIFFDNNLSKLPMTLYELNQLLGNLLTNAFEASESYRNQKKPQVELSFVQSNQHIIILIKNTGQIEQTIRTRLTKPGISSKLKNHSQHGYGMYIISEIVDKYFGNLVIKETNNNYVEIEITVPML